MWPPSGGYFLPMKANIYLKDVVNPHGGYAEMGQYITADYIDKGEYLLLSFEGRVGYWGDNVKYVVDKKDCVIYSFDAYLKEI